MEIPELKDLDQAFGTTQYLPSMEQCKAPKGFEDIASDIFFNGCAGCHKGLKPKEGVNWKEAQRFVHAHLLSFEPSHEHKIAGCAELLSRYFDLVEEE